jgi:hypothetical protein
MQANLSAELGVNLASFSKTALSDKANLADLQTVA